MPSSGLKITMDNEVLRNFYEPCKLDLGRNSPNRLRVLALPRYGDNVASSRVRMFQFFPLLEKDGLELTHSSFFTDAYPSHRFGGGFPTGYRLRCYLRRLLVLLSARRFDIIWIEKELFPGVPWFIESLFFRAFRRSIVDFDDAWYLRYRESRSALVRFFLKEKIERVIRSGSSIVVGNHFLEKFAIQSGAREVIRIPSVVDQLRFTEANSDRSRPGNAPIVVGWVGTPITWNEYGAPLVGVFGEIAEKYRVKFKIVGAGIDSIDPWLQAVDWAFEDEAKMVSEIDIGLMPLDDTEWARGKCAYKLLLHMAAARPVVATDVGANRDVVVHGKTGFLVSNGAQDIWALRLAMLIEDDGLRTKMGEEARKRFEKHFSLESQSSAVRTLFRRRDE